MRRRALLVATAGVLGLAGCPSRPGDRSSPGTDSPPTPKATATPVRRTAGGVEASFEVLGGHHPTPTPRPVAASFEGGRVVVTGTMDPAGCREPALRSVDYDASIRTLRLVVGTESEFGPTATVVCDNAVYRYRCVVTVEDRTPAAVEVVHELHERDDRTFVRENE